MFSIWLSEFNNFLFPQQKQNQPLNQYSVCTWIFFCKFPSFFHQTRIFEKIVKPEFQENEDEKNSNPCRSVISNTRSSVKKQGSSTLPWWSSEWRHVSLRQIELNINVSIGKGRYLISSSTFFDAHFLFFLSFWLDMELSSSVVKH